MNWVVCVASHINSDERINYFIEMLNSIDNLKPNRTLISISFESKYKDKCYFLKNKYNNIEFYFQEKKLLQFEHLEFLSTKVDDNDLVIFIDDDDLFKEKVRKHIQNLLDQGIKSSSGLQQVIRRTNNHWKLESKTQFDHSGTFCSGLNFKNYFNSEIREKAWNYCNKEKNYDYERFEEDCVFNEYLKFISEEKEFHLDSFKDQSEPWIIHRDK